MAEILDGGRLAAQALRREGVTHVFGICGAPVLEVFRGVVAEGIRAVGVRHEQSATFMAQAWSYLTGEPGVAIAASGPAMINCVTGLANAWSNGFPLVVIGGSSPQTASHRGAFQEAPQVELARPVSKWAGHANDARRIPELVNAAVRAALAGRPGPAYLDLPADVIAAVVDSGKARFPEPVRRPAPPSADEAQLKRAVDLLRRAKRPLLVVGKGAVMAAASPELREIVDLGVPFAASPMGRGVIRDDHALNANAARSAALRGADVILMVGARFNWMFEFGRPNVVNPDAKVIQVDIDPGEFGHNRPADVALFGDAKVVAGQLLEELRSGEPLSDLTAWHRELARDCEANRLKLRPLAESDQLPLAPQRVMAAIEAFKDDDAIVVDDGEACMAVSRQLISTNHPGHRLNAGTFGCMGFGVPAAIAAKLARPDRQVISINGDSAFGFNGMEVETAVRVKAPVIFVVFNNDGIVGSELQDAFFPAGTEAVATLTPGARYDKVMEAFGGHAEYVERPDEMLPALQRSKACGLPSLINVKIDPRNGGGTKSAMRYG